MSNTAFFGVRLVIPSVNFVASDQLSDGRFYVPYRLQNGG